MSNNKTKFYWLKNGLDYMKCPLCDSKLASCHVGCYCSDKNCPYVDGGAFLTDKEAIKYKDKIIK